MEEVADALKDFSGRLSFKQWEQFAFLLTNVTLKKVSEFCDLDSHAFGVGLFETPCKLFHIPVVPQEIVDLGRSGRDMLYDQRKECPFLIGKVGCEMLGEKRADKSRLLRGIGRPSDHHDPPGGLDLLGEEQPVVMIL